MSALEKRSLPATLIDVDVGPRDPYKYHRSSPAPHVLLTIHREKSFVYRTHPQIRLTAIPTLLRWAKVVCLSLHASLTLLIDRSAPAPCRGRLRFRS